MKAGLTIGRLAREADVGIETVRYYQRRGLLDVPERAGQVHRYGSEDVRRLRFIRAAQACGFTLDEIGELLELDRSEDRARVRAISAERIAALDERIRQLQAHRSALERLHSKCTEGTKGPCPIIEAFDR